MKIKQLQLIRAEHLLKKIKTYISPFLNWRILIIYVPIWFIMSGWTYLFIFLGTRHHVGWMLAAGTFWATVLWLPFTPEKLITIPITLVIYVKLFGHKESEKLERMLVEAKQDWEATKRWFRRNYPRMVKTMIVVLLTLLILLFLLIK